MKAATARERARETGRGCRVESKRNERARERERKREQEERILCGQQSHRRKELWFDERPPRGRTAPAGQNARASELEPAELSRSL